jgi:hypothetical protein
VPGTCSIKEKSDKKMAKKVRRPRKRRVETVSTTAEAAETTPSKSMTDQEVFESDYAYVLKDLRWVFILAAIMFALLIALNLILTR